MKTVRCFIGMVLAIFVSKVVFAEIESFCVGGGVRGEFVEKFEGRSKTYWDPQKQHSVMFERASSASGPPEARCSKIGVDGDVTLPFLLQQGAMLPFVVRQGSSYMLHICGNHPLK